MSPARTTGFVLVLALAMLPGIAGAGPSAPVSKQLAAGSSAVAPCGTLSGVVVDFTVTATTVTAVQLSGIPATCNGAQVTATVTNATGTSVGAGGPVAISGGTATITVSPTPAFASVAAVRLAVVGP